MWTIWALFISFSALAIDINETVRNVKINKVLPDNILVFNKGLEDGVSRNDHIMVMKENEGYASRGLCLKSDMTESYWKVYRIPQQEAFSKDYNYVLTGIADKEIPAKIAALKEEFFTFQKVQEGEFQIEPDVPEALGKGLIQVQRKNLKK
jgi:hypothetical protein